MKNKGLFALLLLLLIASFSLTAKKSSNDITESLKLESFESHSLDDLSIQDKMLIYELNKKPSPLGPVLLNVFLPFSLGSFIQGNSTDAWTTLTLGTIGLGMAYVGYLDIILSNDFFLDEDGSSQRIDDHDYSFGPLLFLGGSVLLLVTLIKNITDPITYANDYNEKLTNSIYFGGYEIANNTYLDFIPKLDDGKFTGSLLAKINL